ncbi:hypothetical protein TOPH_08040 [Tolypocladium ophioglossoides CBS 100239]|uniref:Transcription factor domain-containing protein n=1 Tax=Tolypocladium ophioglossoides (strain CBS 100239) TaxID=1163406 RepID=A0A0L0MZS0_TOLOC|nr:hypothetical protein TOPH_08040 [Tolypocladium ophioglossoides CBS 100239]
MAVIRDSILDICLQATACGGREILLDLKAREINMISQFPACIVYRDGDVTNKAVDGPTLYSRILVRLEHLQNLFFIERLLAKEGRAPDSQMLEISMELVSLTLIFWTHQGRLHGLHSCHDWLVVSYAAPAGGVLCLELLKASAPRAASPTVTRSNMIQQLSLLVGFLDWVGPSAPNSDICQSVKRVVRHVLDQTLNPAADQAGAAEGLGFSADMNEFFSFDLLDTFDWLRPESASWAA